MSAADVTNKDACPLKSLVPNRASIHQSYLAVMAINPTTTTANAAVCSQKLLAKLLLLEF
jgi:hypothetical protein